MKQFLLISLNFMWLNIFGQVVSNENETLELKRNTIYLTGGIGLLEVVDINYERLINQKQKGFFKSYFFKVSGGRYITWENTGTIFSSGFTGLTGLKKSHFEVNLGLSYNIDPDDQNFLPLIAAGYRFQNPEKRFIFRTGLSIPESLYLSFGFGF